MAVFKPCVSRFLCSDTGTHCKSCGRPVKHVQKTREIIDELAQLVVDADYANVEDFLKYVQSRTNKKVTSRREKAKL